AGVLVGGSGGSGVLIFHGRRYPISIGGVSAGLVFGASRTNFRGTVTNIRGPYDVVRVYSAARAGGAVRHRPHRVVLRTDKGAILRVAGPQVGLQVNLDLSGMGISAR